MSLYQDIINELGIDKNTSHLSRKQVGVLEKAIFKDLKEKNAQCVKCKRKHRLTLDHIIPKEMLKSFGIEPREEILEGNYQLLCEPCNMFKSGRLDFSVPETKKLLMKLIKEL